MAGPERYNPGRTNRRGARVTTPRPPRPPAKVAKELPPKPSKIGSRPQSLANAAAKYERDLAKAGEELSRGSRRGPRFGIGKIIGVGGALSLINPFGIPAPWGGLVPVQGPGVFGKDIGALCYVSVCTPTVGPVGIEVNNVCTPHFPACPFGSPLPGLFMRGSYLEALQAVTGDTSEDSRNAWPYANLMYIKGGLGAGYFVHEVQFMGTSNNVEFLERAKVATDTSLAPWAWQPNPNNVPAQQPEPQAKPEPGDPNPSATRGDRAERRRTVTIGRRVARTPPRRGRLPPRNPRRPTLNETKLQFNQLPGYRLFMGAIDALTETQDFVRALYQGLPCSIRGGRWVPTRGGGRRWQRGPGYCHKYDTNCQHRQLAKHVDKIDWSEAWANVVANAVEDATIGMQQRAVGELTGATKSEAGYARFKSAQQALKLSGEELLAAMRAQGLLKGGCR